MNSSLIERQIIPLWAKEQGLTRCFVYTGPSMIPTFCPGHLLYVRPTAHDITSGDVIVFADPSGNSYVVHRIVAMTDTEFVTRGDNNSSNDPFPILSDQVIGRVEIVDNQGCLKLVQGGNRGLWGAWIRWGIRRADRWLRHAFRLPYQALRNSSVFRRFFSRWFSCHLKVVRLKTPDGPLFKTTYRGRTVACWWPKLNRFECRKPFDLVIPRPDASE